jgi:thiamine biosynthesis lipoprotein
VRSARWPALGTTAHLLVTADVLEPAVALLHEELEAVDLACSRFRRDSELLRLRPGRQRVSPVLAGAVRCALQAAAETDGLVDPTLGRSLVALGYDRTFSALPADGPAAVPLPAAREAWRAVRLDGDELDLPAGVLLDLGATAKAWAADRAAVRLAGELGGGVLVNLGGDLAVAGDAPADGWPVDAAGSGIALAVGGLATSSTRRRRWVRGGRELHHVLDPRTGASAVTSWQTVSVAGPTCAAANAASTAALVLGAAAPSWLAEAGLPSRLVHQDGSAVVVAGWPPDEAAA